MSDEGISVLGGSYVRDGKLHLTQSLSKERVKRLSNELYNAFVDYEIPHWRVVAFTVQDNGRYPENIISKIEGVNKSYVEMESALSKLILSERHGVYYSPDMAMAGDVLEKAGVGHMMITEHKGVVTTSNGAIRFFSETSIPVRCLTVGEEICNCSSSNIQVYMYYLKGTGIIEYDANDKTFSKARNIVPCRTVFDLTDAVMVAPYRDGDDCVRFTYKKKVDESVLSEILSDYYIVV